MRAPSRLPELLGCLLLCAVTVAQAQGGPLPDLRDPALYRDSQRKSTCRVCGEISSIREVRGNSSIPGSRNPGSTAGNPNDWAVVGAVFLVPIGPGVKDKPYVGAVGTPEMAERLGANTYEITIRMDDGERQVVRRSDGASFYVGERVTLSGGLMAPL
ncbi:MAG TPA: hypothetical protein VMJ14_00455 [Burkholderiales bacterium]|nr:hypothetical protein [Burkholderiales bacterium]